MEGRLLRSELPRGAGVNLGAVPSYGSGFSNTLHLALSSQDPRQALGAEPFLNLPLLTSICRKHRSLSTKIPSRFHLQWASAPARHSACLPGTAVYELLQSRATELASIPTPLDCHQSYMGCSVSPAVPRLFEITGTPCLLPSATAGKGFEDFMCLACQGSLFF